MADEEKDSTQMTQATAPSGSATSATTQPAGDPDSRRVGIVRVEREDGPMHDVPYEDGSGHQRHWYPGADKDEFEVPAMIAVAAVASGFFEQAANSRTKLKRSNRDRQ
ncbi:MAG TPA: hypothetical protein VJ464_15845 [Blastocatellia bacterium]|nr:hypothetical protein [Blastocatellia bacterium]